jgi:tripartite-type tricarboxylate transporter receptor subunit TctC
MKFARLIVAAAALLFAAVAAAQDYPSKPIRLIVPQPPGGGFDLVARVVAEKLSQRLGQNVVVENRPGSGTLVGTEAAAKSPADGYTLLLGALSNIALNPGLYKSLPYDPLRDFVPIGLAVTYSYTLIGRKDLPFESLQDVIAYARANPNKLTYASGGNGSGQHVGAAVIWNLAGVQLTHVPYKGAQAAYQDLLAGRVDVFLDITPTAKPHVDRGAVKAIAISSGDRDPAHPNLRTVREQGLPQFAMESWFGYFAPAKTPQPIVDKLRAEFAAAVQSPEVVERFEKGGGRVLKLTPAQTEALVKQDTERWTSLIRTADVQAD